MANYTCIHGGPAGGAVSALHLVCHCRGPPSHRTIFTSCWPSLAWPGAGGTSVQESSFGTLRWSSLLQKAPQLMKWDKTVKTWTSKATLSRPAVALCPLWQQELSTYILSLQRPIICSIVFWGWTFVSLFCYFNDTSALIAASQSSVRLSPVALRDKMIALESVIRLICYLWINWFPH